MYYKKINHPVWKYELTEDVHFYLEKVLNLVEHEYYSIVPDYEGGTTTVTVKKGYAWDGVTSPDFAKGILDAKIFRKASLIHDVLLQAIYDDKQLHPRFIGFSHKVFMRQVARDANWYYAGILYTGLFLFHGIWHKLNK